MSLRNSRGYYNEKGWTRVCVYRIHFKGLSDIILKLSSIDSCFFCCYSASFRCCFPAVTPGMSPDWILIFSIKWLTVKMNRKQSLSREELTDTASEMNKCSSRNSSYQPHFTACVCVWPVKWIIPAAQAWLAFRY